MGAVASVAGFLGSVFSVGSTLVEHSQQADALKQQGEFEQRTAEANKRLAEINAADAIRRGEVAALDVGKATRQAIGAQRASAAAQGIDVNVGTPVALAAESAGAGAADAVTIRQNAWKEAWGYKVQALGYKEAGQQAIDAARNTAKTTLLTGGLKSLSKAGEGLYKYKDLFSGGSKALEGIGTGGGSSFGAQLPLA